MNTDDQIKLAQAQLIQHTAEQMGIDVNTLSTEDLAKFASHVLAEAGTSQAEQELETKVAEADALGRLMARSFVEEQAKVAQEEMAAQEMPGYGRAALRGAAMGALGGGLLQGGLGAALGHYGPSAGLPGDVFGVGGKGALYGAGVAGGAGAIQGAALGATLGLGRAALQRRAIAAQQAAAAAPVEEKVASAMGDIQNFWAMKIAEEMEEESAAEEAAMENESAEQEAEEEAAAEDEAKEAMLHLAQALHANGRTKTAGALLTKLAQEEMAAQEMPGYGRAALRGAALGALGGGLANAGLGAALGHYAPAGFPGDPLGVSGQGALQGALRGGGAGAAIGAGLGTMGSLARTALQRRAIAKQQEAAKQAAYEFAKLAEEEMVAREMPSYTRNTLQGIGLGGMLGGIGGVGYGLMEGGGINPISGVLAAGRGITGAAAGGALGGLAGLGATAIQRKRLGAGVVPADRIIIQQEAAKQAAYDFAKLAEARAAEIMAANGIHPATLESIAPSNVKIAHVVTPDAVHSYEEKVAAAQFNEQLDSAALHILKSIGFV